MSELVNRALAFYNSRDRDRGASAVEYALILVAIAAAVALLVSTIGGVVVGKFTDACKAIHNNAPC